MSHKHVVIYCRYSSDMQRADSCADQERAVRAGLARLGVWCDDAVVITDEAESGTRSDRDGFQRLAEMVRRREVAVVGVEDQSRLTRAGNAFSFVQDLVFAGARFVSVGEGIDTAADGWEMKVQVMQLHHGQTVRDLQHLVRRGQKGRVRDDGSAGDFPYGYEAYYLDPDWQAQLACGACGGRMHQAHSNARRYYACAGAKKGLCGMTTQVPADRAETELTGFVLDLLRGWPEWAGAVYRRTCTLIREAAARVPDEQERDRKRAADLDTQIRRLLDLSVAGGGGSPALVKRLLEAEGEKAAVAARLAASTGLDAAAVDLPDERWVD